MFVLILLSIKICLTPNTTTMNEGFDYFRIKMAWNAEQEDGSLAKVKTEDLVYASSYTEAEKIAYALIEDQQRTKNGDVSFEILKTKISELLYNDNLLHDSDLVGGMVYNYLDPEADENIGIYAVKVMLVTVDERTAKEKRTYETLYTPASSNTDAADRISKHLNKSMSDFVIRDIKFDKAESILWPTNVFEAKANVA